MPLSTLGELMEAEEAQAAAIERKQLDNKHW